MGRRDGVGGSGVVEWFSGEDHSILLFRVTVRDRCKGRWDSINKRLSLWRRRDWSSWDGSRSGTTSW